MAKKKSARRTTTKSGEEAASKEDVHIGMRLRHQRMTRRMTLRELADKAECSESLLSKIENGRALPSLTTLHKICRVLGLTVGQLFGKSSEPPGVVARAGERPVLTMHPLRPNSDVRMEQLIPVDPRNLLEGSIHLISPGSGMDLVSHQGEEVAYVIEGTLEISVGSDKYTVNEGDSFYFRSELPHGYRNPGPKVARVIVITHHRPSEHPGCINEFREDESTAALRRMSSNRPAVSTTPRFQGSADEYLGVDSLAHSQIRIDASLTNAR